MNISALQDFAFQARRFREAAEKAMRNKDNPHVLTLMSLAMRQVRHDREWAKFACSSAPPPIDNLEELTAQALDDIRAAVEGDKLLWEHAQRNRDPFPNFESEDDFEVADYLDARLPPEWDYREGLIVLIGERYKRVEVTLRKLGQERIIFAEPGQHEQLYKAIRVMRPRPPRGLYIMSTHDTMDEQIAQRGDEAIRDVRVFGNTLRSFATTWLRNGLINMHKIKKLPPVYMLGNMVAGRPMLLVAPGPSLDKNLALIKQLKHKAVIFTMSHALKILQDNGVDPDFVITVDSNRLLYHFDGCDTSRVTLITGITCHPGIFNLPCLEHLWMGANASADSWIIRGVADNAFVGAGGSVATTAVALAIHLGCSGVIAVGLDCALSGGRMYSKDSHDSGVTARVDGDKVQIGGWSNMAADMMEDEDYADEKPQDLFTLPAWDGDGEVPTTFIFKMFHSWFRTTAEQHNDALRFINATEGGAFIPGWEHIPLAQAIEEYKDIQPVNIKERVQWIRKSPECPDLRKPFEKRYSQTCRAMKKARTTVNKLLAALDAGDEAAVVRHEKSLASQLDFASPLDILLQDVLQFAMDRLQTTTSLHLTELTAKEMYLAMSKALEYILEQIDQTKIL